MKKKIFPEVKLVPERTTSSENILLGFPRACNPHLGFRHKIGGSPDWIQGEETPKCPECGLPMSFYGQLDSLGEDFDIGDCGMIYVFLCEDCLTTVSIMQYY